MTAYDWRCEACGTRGGTEMRSDEGAWSGAETILMLHRSVSPDCKAGADSIRVTPREPVVLKPRRAKVKP